MSLLDFRPARVRQGLVVLSVLGGTATDDPGRAWDHRRCLGTRVKEDTVLAPWLGDLEEHNPPLCALGFSSPQSGWAR